MLIVSIVKPHLTLQKYVLSSRRIASHWRKKGHAFSFAHSTRKAAYLAESALRPVNLAQTLLELLDLLDLSLAAVNGHSTLVEADIAVPTGAIAVVLHGSRVDNRRRRVILTPLEEACNWWRVRRSVGLEKAAIVSLDKSVPTCAVGEIVHVEGARVHLRALELVHVLAGEHVGRGDAAD